MKKLFAVVSLPVLLFLCACGGGSSAPKPAATADGAVMQVVEALNENNAAGPWHMLPAGYQSELNSVKTAFAEKLDAEVYNGGADLVAKLGSVLKTKMKLILANPMLQGVPMRSELESNYDHLVTVLGILGTSEYASLEGLKTTGIGEFLTSTGSELMEAASRMEISDESPKPMGMNSMMKVPGQVLNLQAELVSEEGDSAVVKLTTEGEEPEEMTFVRVEGKWIPEELAKDFPEMIEQMRKSVAEFEMTPQMKSQALMGINMANRLLDQIASAETQEELQVALGGVLGGL